jgi:hypothetical protein
MRSRIQFFCGAAAALAFAFSMGADALAQPTVDLGYLDYFELSDGRVIDVGALGGGLDNQPTVHKTSVTAQPTSPNPPNPTDGRLTGIIHGKFRIVGLTDLSGNGFIAGEDLDLAFDVSWQLVGFDKNQGPASAFFVQDSPVGVEGTLRPYGPGNSVNFPPTPNGTAAVWNVAACDGTGFNPGTGSNFCNPFAIGAPFFTGFVDYTFPVSIPAPNAGANDFTPGLVVGSTNWILAALVGRRAEATPAGPISYGFTPAFSPVLAVNESENDLFGPNTFLNFPGETANVAKATLLTTVQIEVTPEPGTLAMLGLGLAFCVRRRRR